MGASRENFSLFKSLKNKHWKKLKKDFKTLIGIGTKYSINYERHLIIMDTFKTPFHRHIGCRLVGHKWSNEEENKKYDFSGFSMCWKCYRSISSTDLKSDTRDRSIKRILN